MVRLIREAGIIVCRPGYSTLMDLAALGRNAVLVPTPGQTEQEYLAEYLAASGTFCSMSQEQFNLSEALREGAKLAKSRFIIENDQSLLNNAISDLAGKSRRFS
jgi:UDP-N-acetylglucosamine:LPS N-acetylglucosamine transferase